MSIAACLMSRRGWFRSEAQVVISAASSGFADSRVLLQRLLDFLGHVKGDGFDFSVIDVVVGSHDQALVIKVILVILDVRFPAIHRVTQAGVLPPDCEWIFRNDLADLNLFVGKRFVFCDSLNSVEIGSFFQKIRKSTFDCLEKQ